MKAKRTLKRLLFLLFFKQLSNLNNFFRIYELYTDIRKLCRSIWVGGKTAPPPFQYSVNNLAMTITESFTEEYSFLVKFCNIMRKF